MPETVAALLDGSEGETADNTADDNAGTGTNGAIAQPKLA